jgi:hypothetical protein
VTAAERVEQLVTQLLDDFDVPGVTAGSLVRGAARVARLHEDWEDLLWLEREQIGLGERAASKPIYNRMASHFDLAGYAEIWNAITESLIAERTIRRLNPNTDPPDEDRSVQPSSIDSLEEQAAALVADIEATATPPQLQSTAVHAENTHIRVMLTEQRSNIIAIIGRIRARVHEYLSRVEQQLLLGQVTADLFQRNREYVDSRLRVIAPDVLDQFAAAYERAGQGSSEALSHALTSCRRVLKSLADALYPPGPPAVGADGKPHFMTDDKVVNRLTQFVTEHRIGAASGTVLIDEVSRASTQLRNLNDLASKGVHANVSTQEVEQCLIQVYIVVGDLLRLHDGLPARL